mgnify:CR=1 FL=1
MPVTDAELKRPTGHTSKGDTVKDADAVAAHKGEMTDEQFELVQAVDRYKRVNAVNFPRLTDILWIMKKLGYKKS